MGEVTRHRDHGAGVICRPAGHGLCEPLPDDVRAIGTVTGAHGAPLTVGVYRGLVNVAGRMLDRGQAEEFGRLFISACWEASAHADRDDPP